VGERPTPEIAGSSERGATVEEPRAGSGQLRVRGYEVREETVVSSAPTVAGPKSLKGGASAGTAAARERGGGLPDVRESLGALGSAGRCGRGFAMDGGQDKARTRTSKRA
jgi:hypothetical protein